jgi:Zn-dependent protease with chaperone function
MDDLWPPGPANAPADLTAPTRKYKLHVASALAGLAIFVGVYLGLVFWLGSLVWTVIARGGGPGVLVALPALFVLAFLVSGLFVVRRASAPEMIEITEADEPRLFAFVRRVADEVGAPRPHRVFLSPDVNAAVFYDLAFWNLVVPTKKNLVIGLGLVNVLTLDEFKAVLAHEFGHFAQRSMGVSRYVYTAWQIIGHVVRARGVFDTILGFVSRIDIRVAWIGWLLRLVVWSIRALLDTLFRGLLALERALSREMELQADLVAVSLTGSDSLVHGLRRLTAADEAWNRAIGRAGAEVSGGRIPADLYAVQTRMLERIRQIRGEPTYGLVPARPTEGAASWRVFPDELAAPPRMWSTHPPNREREENAKRVYLPSALDERPAWALFADPAQARRRLTAHLVKLGWQKEGEAVPVEQTLAAVDEGFAHPAMEARYRGVYLGRSVVRGAKDAAALCPDAPDASDEAVRDALSALYPERLVETLRHWRDHETERDQLEALRAGLLEAPGGVVRFRGRELAKTELDSAVEEVKRELAEEQRALEEHDRAVRVAHRQAARKLGRGWEPHLAGLLAVVHYADHVEADVADASDHLFHVFRVVVADGNVSASELARLVAAARDAWTPLVGLLTDAERVSLPPAILADMEIETWRKGLPDRIGLPEPTSENIGEWLGAYEGWTQILRGAVTALEASALRALLDAEQHVREAFLDGKDPGEAPAPARIPARYPTLVPGSERPRTAKLTWWDRIVVADGWGPGAVRLGASVSVLGTAWLFTTLVDRTDVVVHNGLGVPVTAYVGEEQVHVLPHHEVRVPVGSGVITVRAETEDRREIESFEVDLSDGAWGDQVYNVAAGSVLHRWTASYGDARDVPPVTIGAVRWHAGGEDYVFREPPASISTKSGGATREALTALDELKPNLQVGGLEDADQIAAIVRAHVAYDPFDGAFREWVALATAYEVDLGDRLTSRLGEPSGDVVLGRLQQDMAPPEALARICAAQSDLARAAPADADLQYLAARCRPDGTDQDALFQELHARFPDHPWTAWAAGLALAQQGRWAEASPLMDQASAALPEQGFGEDALRVARVLALSRGEALPDRHVFDDPYTVLLEAERDPEGAKARASDYGGVLEGWIYLAAGAPDTAANLERYDLGDPAAEASLLRTAAASDGASKEAVERALALGPEIGLSAQNTWTVVALHLREGRPVPENVRALALGSWSKGSAESILAALEPAALARDPRGLDRALESAPLPLRGHARAAAVVILGEKSPAGWRHEAKGLLYPWERPFLR